MIHAYDVESYLITPGNPVPKMVCLSYASENGETGVLNREEGIEWLKETLAAGDHLVAHNLPFDNSVAAADDPELLVAIFEAYADGRMHDTLNRQKILDNARGALKFEWNEETGEMKGQNYSLAHLVHRLLDKWIFNDKEGDVWRLRYYTLDGIPVEEWPEAAVKYSLDDSIHALQCFFKQQQDPNAQLLDKEWSQTNPDWALRLMSCWGSRTTEDDIEILRIDFQERFDAQAAICLEMGLAQWKTEKGVRKVARKMKPIYKLVEEHYNKHGLPTPMTEGGKGEVKNPQVSTARDTLMMRKHTQVTPHPGMVAVAEMVRVGKLLSTYIPMLQLGITLPISPRYNCIIETFRTSCSKPNIQNLPREGGVRNCWLARPGMVYGFCDYDTLEMRTLAQCYIWLFPKKACPLLKAIVEGKDSHLEFAARMLGITYDEASERLAAGDKVVKDTRQGAKIANYGMAGGMGAEAFVDYARGFGVEISLHRAQQLRDSFRHVWDMECYFEHCSKVAKQKDPDLGVNVVKFLGLGLLRGDVRYTAVCNGYFQHLAAIGAKLALFEVAYACYAKPESPLYGCRPWLFAHDEIGLEVPFDGTDAGRVKASRAMAELRIIMIQSMEHYCPDVPIGATGAMSFRWFKGAEPVFRDIDGEKTLVPCMKEGKEWIEDYEREVA
jgi:DNA polymerase-1